MVSYVLLMKLTEKGAREIKDAPARVDAGIRLFESMGGKVHAFFAVSGDYDYVTFGEGPDDKTALAFTLALESLGNVTVTPLKAYSREEFAAIVDRVPTLALAAAHA